MGESRAGEGCGGWWDWRGGQGPGHADPRRCLVKIWFFYLRRELKPLKHLIQGVGIRTQRQHSHDLWTYKESLFLEGSWFLSLTSNILKSDHLYVQHFKANTPSLSCKPESQSLSLQTGATVCIAEVSLCTSHTWGCLPQTPGRKRHSVRAVQLPAESRTSRMHLTVGCSLLEVWVALSLPDGRVVSAP